MKTENVVEALVNGLMIAMMDNQGKRTYTIKTEGSGIYARCPYDDQYVEKEDCASSHGPKSVEFEVFSHAILVFIGIFIGVNSVL